MILMIMIKVIFFNFDKFFLFNFFCFRQTLFEELIKFKKYCKFNIYIYIKHKYRDNIVRELDLDNSKTARKHQITTKLSIQPINFFKNTAIILF